MRITSRHKENAVEHPTSNTSNADSAIKCKAKSENDLILETDPAIFSESSLSTVAKKRKSEIDYSSTTNEFKKLNPNESNNSLSTTTAMKSLTVMIPSKKSQKPNNILLFRDARKLAEEHENDNIDEFVKCICPLGEESGLMVQCEVQ